MISIFRRARDYLAEPATRTTVAWAMIAMVAVVFMLTAFGVGQR